MALIDCEVELRRTRGTVIIATMPVIECPRVDQIIQVPAGSICINAKVVSVPPEELRERLCKIIAKELP